MESRQPRMGTPEEYQRIVKQQQRNAPLVLAVIVAIVVALMFYG